MLQTSAASCSNVAREHCMRTNLPQQVAASSCSDVLRQGNHMHDVDIAVELQKLQCDVAYAQVAEAQAGSQSVGYQLVELHADNWRQWLSGARLLAVLQCSRGGRCLLSVKAVLRCICQACP